VVEEIDKIDKIWEIEEIDEIGEIDEISFFQLSSSQLLLSLLESKAGFLCFVQKRIRL
jgi:hypothetical protein